MKLQRILVADFSAAIKAQAPQYWIMFNRTPAFQLSGAINAAIYPSLTHRVRIRIGLLPLPTNPMPTTFKVSDENHSAIMDGLTRIYYKLCNYLPTRINSRSFKSHKHFAVFLLLHLLVCLFSVGVIV